MHRIEKKGLGDSNADAKAFALCLSSSVTSSLLLERKMKVYALFSSRLLSRDSRLLEYCTRAVLMLSAYIDNISESILILYSLRQTETLDNIGQTCASVYYNLLQHRSEQ